MNYFRNTLGHFESDRNYMIAAAVINIIFTLLLVIPFGVGGVMIGTVAGHLLIFMGRTVVVYKHYVKKAPFEYYKFFLFRLLIMISTAFISLFITKNIEKGILGLLLKGVFSVVFSTLIFIIYSIRKEEFKVIISYIKKIMGLIKRKNVK